MGSCCHKFFKKKRIESTDTNILPVSQKDLDEKLLSKDGYPSTYNLNITSNDEIKNSKFKDNNHKNNLPKKICLNDFAVIKLVGRGTFGKVLLVNKISNGKFFAMKVLKKSLIKVKNQEDHTRTEREILEKIDHPFIVSLHYAFQDEKNLYLITEFMQGGELFYHLRKEGIFKENKAKFYLCEIVLALEHLHKNNCIYRDLKPENILIDCDGHIKLTDFGLSKLILSKKGEDRAFTICGTPEYLAPEVIMEKGYDKTVDWWSLGALLYEMLAGFSPFKLKNSGDKLDLNLYTRKVVLYPFFSDEAKSLIEGLLTVTPKHRLGHGPNGSENIKSHPFFKNVDWTAVYNKQVIPPSKPKIKEENDQMDLSNFDPMFTKENVFEPNSEKKNTLQEGSSEGNNISNTQNYLNSTGNYDGFTYVKKSLCLLEKE